MQLRTAVDREHVLSTRRSCRARVSMRRRRWRTRTCRYATAAGTAGDHARECSARLGPVKAFRTDYRAAPTPDGADGLDRPFGRAAIGLLRDGPPTTDLAARESSLEPHELDALVAFVQILLEWDDRERRISTRAQNEGAGNDDRGVLLTEGHSICSFEVTRQENGGEGGIRTHVPLTGQDAFEAPPLRPLRYLSAEDGRETLIIPTPVRRSEALALGARPEQVVGLVMRNGLALVAIGLVLGLVAAAGAARLIQTLLFEVRPLDPLVYLRRCSAQLKPRATS